MNCCNRRQEIEDKLAILRERLKAYQARELEMLHDWHLCKGHLLDFFQGLKHLPLPGEIGGYRYPIFLAPLAYRQPAAPAGLHTSAPFHQPLLLIGSL